MSADTLAVKTGDGRSACKESGERLVLGVALGYLVSLVFLTVVLIGGFRYIDLYNSQTAEQQELAMPVVLLLLALPSALGGAVTGWIAYARPRRAAIYVFLLHGLMVTALFDNLEWHRVPGESLPQMLWHYREAVAFFWLLTVTMLLFAVTSASLAGYLRRRRGGS